MLKTVNDKTMLNDSAYAFGKKLVQIYIPASSSLYFGLASIWDLPAADKVTGTLALVATFLGVCLGLSSKQYDASGAGTDGELEVSEHADGHKIFSLNVNGDPEALAEKSSITFKVVPKE